VEEEEEDEEEEGEEGDEEEIQRRWSAAFSRPTLPGLSGHSCGGSAGG